MEGIVEYINGTAVVTLPGDQLDANNAKAFRLGVEPLIQECNQIVLDLGRLNFIDSSGLGTILSLRRQLKERGGDLRLCGITQQVSVLLKLVNADRILPIFPSRTEAINSFRATNAA